MLNSLFLSAGEIEAETQGVLHAEGVIDEPFSEEVLNCLPAEEWTITPQDRAERQDFTGLR